jgi:hypothetical protein
MIDRKTVEKALEKYNFKEANGMDTSEEMGIFIEYLLEREQTQTKPQKRLFNADILGTSREKCDVLVGYAYAEMQKYLDLIQDGINDNNISAVRDQCILVGEIFDLLSDNLVSLYGAKSAEIPELSSILQTKLDTDEEKSNVLKSMKEYAKYGLKTLDFVKEALNNENKEECAVLSEHLFDSSYGIELSFNIYVSSTERK